MTSGLTDAALGCRVSLFETTISDDIHYHLGSLLAGLKPIRRDKMGEGWYYYHAAPLDRLESIKKLGLTTRERHKMPGYGTVTEHITNLVYLWPQERTAIGWISSVEAGILLRFRRDVDDGTPYYDENFAQNQAPYGMTLVEHVQFRVEHVNPCR